MVLLSVLGGWFLLSCIAAPLIGRFIAVNSPVIELEDEPARADAQYQPVSTF